MLISWLKDRLYSTPSLLDTMCSSADSRICSTVLLFSGHHVLISWLKDKFYSTPFLLDSTCSPADSVLGSTVLLFCWSQVLVSWLSVRFYGTPFSVLVSWLKDRHYKLGDVIYFMEKIKAYDRSILFLWNHVLIVWLVLLQNVASLNVTITKRSCTQRQNHKT